MISRPCIWTRDEDEDNAWDTLCGDKHIFIVDGPLENKYKYCPYCGRDLRYSVEPTPEWEE